MGEEGREKKQPMRNTEYGIRNTEYGIRNTEYGIRNTEYGIQITFIIAFDSCHVHVIIPRSTSETGNKRTTVLSG